MTEPTIEDFKEEFKGEKFAALRNELNSDPFCFDLWKRRTEAQWEKEIFALNGKASGFSDVYNYLHPQREQGNIVGMTGNASGNGDVLAGTNYLFSGKLLGAKQTMGVHATLCRLASNFLGFHEGENDAFWYEGDDLTIRVLFKSNQNADYFHRRLKDDFLYHNTAISGLGLIADSLSPTSSVAGKPIFSTDCIHEKVDPPQVAVSVVSTATPTVVDSSTPLFQFQRIESDSVFGRRYKADSCYLIEKAHYAGKPQEVDDVENNRLAMSRGAHCWFDGRSCEIPLFKLTISNAEPISPGPVIENRYEVPLLVTAFDDDCARLLFPQLKEGTIFHEGDRKLEAIVKVYVLNPQVFTQCIEWKASKTQELWDEYCEMQPAVI